MKPTLRPESAGSSVTIILGSKCGMDKEQKITMDAVSEIVKTIADLTGPSCCKAYARKSIEVAQNFLERTACKLRLQAVRNSIFYDGIFIGAHLKNRHSISLSFAARRV